MGLTFCVLRLGFADWSVRWDEGAPTEGFTPMTPPLTPPYEIDPCRALAVGGKLSFNGLFVAGEREGILGVEGPPVGEKLL